MNLKKSLIKLGVAAALAVSAMTPATAAENGVVDVPFAFEYLGTTMPAGKYMVRYNGSPSAMLLTRMDNRGAIQVAVRPTWNSGKQVKLVFDVSGTKAVLKPVQ